MKKKVNIPYLLTYILVAILLCFSSMLIVIAGAISNDDSVLIPGVLCALLMILWLVLVPIIAPSVFKKMAYSRLAKNGFNIEKVYKAYTYSLVMDITGGRVAMIYSFNPTTPYVFPAKKIQKIWIDEKKRDSDNYIGLIGVRFIVDNKEESFDTYHQSVGKTGTKVYLPPNHPNIISARQNANNIVAELNKACEQSESIH